MFKDIKTNDERRGHVRRLEGNYSPQRLNTIDVDTGLFCKGCTLNGLMQVQKGKRKAGIERIGYLYECIGNFRGPASMSNIHSSARPICSHVA